MAIENEIEEEDFEFTNENKEPAFIPIIMNDVRLIIFMDELNDQNSAFLYYIPNSRADNGVLLVMNQFKNNVKKKFIENKKKLRRDFFAVKSLIMKKNPTYFALYEGSINWG